MDRIEQLLNTPLTDANIESTGVRPDEILKYKDLAQFKDIEHLLPNNGSFKIILIEWAPHEAGHWVMCYKIQNKYGYFNSYGNCYDKDLNVLNRCMKVILGEDVAQFTRLLNGKKMKHSTKRYQKGNVQTCGRWCVFRKDLMNSQSQFDSYMKNTKEKHPDLSFDELICMLCPI